MKHPLWSDGDGQLTNGQPTRRYLVVPSLDDPRLVVQTRPRRASEQIVQALRDRSSVRARTRTTGMRLAILANARTTTLPDPPLFAVVASSVGGDAATYSFGVQLGPPRANRKPVVAVSDSSGALVAFAKQGVGPLTNTLVAHEADSLRALRGLTVTQVPQLIGSGNHDGFEYLVQTPVPTASHKQRHDTVVAAQVEVAHWERDTVDASACLAAVRERWERRAESTDKLQTTFGELAASWCHEMTSVSVPWGSWHGDWRTTNMAITRDGCSVWDWERYTRGVPVGYDALHLFLTSRASAVRDLTTLPEDVRDHAARLLRPFGVVDRRDVELVTTGYFLELAGRYLDDDQARSGALLGAVGQWLLPHLQTAATASHRSGGS